jgi:drug/metabolite transporter (DMT)-like permease
MTWLDKVRNWNYDLAPVWEWGKDIVQFHVERIGWPAYAGVVVAVIGVGLAIPATRGMTALLVSGVIRMAFTYVQLVFSLLTVQATGYLAKLFLSQVHRLKRWISELATKQ